MPRDLSLLVSAAPSSEAPELTKSPERVEDAPQSVDSTPTDAEPVGLLFSQMAQQDDRRNEIHPYTQTLSVSDIESCVMLENAAFPEHERATREKFQYRLSTCGELSMGIFTSLTHKPPPDSPPNPTPNLPTAPTANPVYAPLPTRKSILLGHIVATKSLNPTVTDADMSIPSTSASSTVSPDHGASAVGHSEQGRTLCLHSLAVLPAYRHRGLGATLLKAYLQRMRSQREVADRVALVAHEHLVPWYERFGFKCLGRSSAGFGGGGWWDCVLEFGEEGEGSGEGLMD